MQADLEKVQGEEESGTDMFRANLEAFKEHAPYLHKRLASIEQPHSSLLVDPDGSLDMALLGKRFYDCDACRFAEEQLEAYFESPHRFAFAEPNPELLEGSNAGYCLRLTEGLRDLGVDYDLNHCPEGAHFLLVFGVGLGLHVETLIERTQARAICLIEPNLECLYHSLYVTDWRGIFDLAEAKDLDLSFVVERSPKQIGGKLRLVLRRNLPTFVDGVYIYTHYQSAILQQGLDFLRNDLVVALAGLGFLEDEVVMTTNAATNLSGREVAMLCGAHPPKEVPVFIVGSGPSVDRDLDFVLTNRERVMIFSIGTGLRILRMHGVTPDFHFEIENGEFNADLMAATAEEFDLTGVTLVGSVTVQPRMLTYFEKAYVFFREDVSSTKIFARDLPILQPAGPTVANTALAAGLRMGFREYYLFGVDMGTRTEGKFHADDSVYSLGKFKDTSEEENRFAGNFGGEVFGERVLNWSRTTLESVIGSHPDLAVYNCSDGAWIAGAIPKVSRALELTNPVVDREAVKREISRYINVVMPERTAELWCHRTRQAELNDFLDQIEAILMPLGDAPDPSDDWMLEVGRAIMETKMTNPIIASYLSGTLQILLGVTRWYDRRVEDAQGRANFRRYATGVLLEYVRRFRGDLSELFEQIQDRLAGANKDAGLERPSEPEILEARR